MEFVVARYDLDKVYRELLVSLIVPIVLFVVSSISLCIITKSVKVIWEWHTINYYYSMCGKEILVFHFNNSF